MPKSIKKRLVESVIWSSIEKILVKGSAFIIGIILARLLSPSDYGLIGMLSIFISLSTIFIESGFAKALIQKQNRTEIVFSTTFLFNLGSAIIIYWLFYLIAPWIALFYEAPQLSPLLRVLSLNIIIGSLNIVQRAKLMISMDFKTLAKVNFGGTIIGGIVGIYMAYKNYNVWALVGQNISSTGTMAILFFYYTKWKPTFFFSIQSFKTLFGFGSKLLITGTVATIFNNITTIAIGKLYKSNELGFYTRASQFTEMIAWTINDVLGNVTFPVLSELQNEKDRMLSVYKKSLFYSSLITFPIMILLAILAKPLVIVLLTDKWLPCVPLIQILCLARMLTPLSAINMNLLNAIGRSDLYMKVDLSKLPLECIILAITIPLGIKAIVIGNLIATIICFFINGYYPKKFFNYGGWEQLKDSAKIFLALIFMGGTTYFSLSFFQNHFAQLLIGSLTGGIIYLLCCYMLRIIDFKIIYQKFNN